MHKKISHFRDSIATLDRELLDIIKKRIAVSHQIGQIKADNNLPIDDLDQENRIIANISDQSLSDTEGIISLWRELMYISKREQYKLKSNQDTIKIGVQWWEWSFNHIAIEYFLSHHPDFWEGKKIDIVYLFTTDAVLDALNSGAIDYGQFALANSIGGIVWETIWWLGKYRWKYIMEYAISVEHSLLLYPDTPIEQITTIMWHEQAVRQCEVTLKKLFPNANTLGGTWDLTDNASIAAALASWQLPRNIAAIGHRSLANIHSLQIYQENIHDRHDNETTFVLVWR